MTQFNIEGTLKLTAPLHVATPGDRVINVDTLEPRNGKSRAKEFVSYTGTTKYPLTFSETDLQDEEVEDPIGRGVVDVPVFPANDARGRLRRFAAEEIFKVLRQRGELLTLDSYHAMTCGAATGQPGRGLQFDRALKSGRHVFLGMFGGGPQLISSSVRINTLWPITKTTINAGLVSSACEDDKVLLRMKSLTKSLFYRRIDDALVFTDGRSPELTVKEYSKSVAAWITELGSARSDEGERTRHKKTLRMFGAIEYVIPGTRFYSEMKIDTERTGLGSLGLFIHALAAFANKQGIGGWTRNGFGRFESQFDIVTDANVRVPVLTKTAAGYEPNVDAEQVAEALDAWSTAAATITAAELEELYALPVIVEEAA